MQSESLPRKALPVFWSNTDDAFFLSHFPSLIPHAPRIAVGDARPSQIPRQALSEEMISETRGPVRFRATSRRDINPFDICLAQTCKTGGGDVGAIHFNRFQIL